MHTNEELRAMIQNGTMRAELWEALDRSTREAVRDVSDLSPQLVGLEGHRVEVLDLATGVLRRFIVGRSTGWKPCHLEIKTRRSMGGGPADKSYRSVRVLEKVRER